MPLHPAPSSFKTHPFSFQLFPPYLLAAYGGQCYNQYPGDVVGADIVNSVCAQHLFPTHFVHWVAFSSWFSREHRHGTFALVAPERNHMRCPTTLAFCRVVFVHLHSDIHDSVQHVTRDIILVSDLPWLPEIALHNPRSLGILIIWDTPSWFLCCCVCLLCFCHVIRKVSPCWHWLSVWLFRSTLSKHPCYFPYFTSTVLAHDFGYRKASIDVGYRKRCSDSGHSTRLGTGGMRWQQRVRIADMFGYVLTLCVQGGRSGRKWNAGVKAQTSPFPECADYTVVRWPFETLQRMVLTYLIWFSSGSSTLVRFFLYRRIWLVAQLLMHMKKSVLSNPSATPFSVSWSQIPRISI